MSDFSKTNNLWNGRRERERVLLDGRVPYDGEIKGEDNAALELFRQFSNAYYELYNNGGCNWGGSQGDYNEPDFGGLGSEYRNVCRFFEASILTRAALMASIDSDGFSEELEALGDKVIDAAMTEQFPPIPETV